MKKIFCNPLIVVLCLFIFNVIYQANSSQTVLLVGNIIGFEIETYRESEQYKDYIPTSSQKLGTVTFIKKETHEFAALGHSVITNNSEITGICHEININRIDKSSDNHIGSIYGTLKSHQEIGTVSHNNEYGIFGVIDNINENNYQEIQTANRYEIKLGEAELLISLENEKIQSFKIEIKSIDYISKNKNIKIEIKDENLLARTGGVVQGMSGAPIVQNGKLIGALNYADANNPEYACAIFIDKLL